MLKNRTKIGSAVDKGLYAQIQELSKKTRVPIARFLDEAIIDLLKKYDVDVKDQ